LSWLEPEEGMAEP